MTIHLDLKEKDLKSGVLGLVMSIVEIIRDVLKLQATRRMDDGKLDDEEVERLGLALMELDRAVEEIKLSYGLNKITGSVRRGLDDLVDDLIRQALYEPMERISEAPPQTDEPVV